jgi:hypothetical protein
MLPCNTLHIFICLICLIILNPSFRLIILHNTFKHSRSQEYKSNTNEIILAMIVRLFVDDKSIPAQEKLSYCVVLTADSGLRSDKCKGNILLVQTNCHM